MSYRTVDHHHLFPSLTHSYHSFQYGQTPLSIAQRLGYVSVVETLKTVTETTVITETTVPQEERYKPQNPEAMNETMFSESEDEGLLKLSKFLEDSSEQSRRYCGTRGSNCSGSCEGLLRQFDEGTGRFHRSAYDSYRRTASLSKCRTGGQTTVDDCRWTG